MARLTYHDASELGRIYKFDPAQDWHAMDTDSKEGVLAAADVWKYRKPKNANGSRGRYFAEYVRRAYEKGPNHA